MLVDECAMTRTEYAKYRAEQIEHEEKEAQTEKQLCEVRKVIADGDWSGLVWDTHEAKKVPVTDLFSRFLSEEKDGQEDTAKAIIRALAGHPVGLWQLTREFFGWYEKECMA